MRSIVELLLKPLTSPRATAPARALSSSEVDSADAIGLPKPLLKSSGH